MKILMIALQQTFQHRREISDDTVPRFGAAELPHHFLAAAERMMFRFGTFPEKAVNRQRNAFSERVQTGNPCDQIEDHARCRQQDDQNQPERGPF